MRKGGFPKAHKAVNHHLNMSPTIVETELDTTVAQDHLLVNPAPETEEQPETESNDFDAEIAAVEKQTQLIDFFMPQQRPIAYALSAVAEAKL